MSFFLSSEIFTEESQDLSGFFTKVCTSTMDLAWELYGKGLLAEWSWIRAQTQTQGRGRLGRRWVSDEGNLMVSLRLPDKAGNMGTFLSLALAFCLVRVLEDIGIYAQIKWPNDIMSGFEKLGGILIEQRKEVIVAGIGLNIGSAPVNSPTEDFFQFRATCLKKTNANIDILNLWTLFLNSIRSELTDMVLYPEKAAEAVEKFLAFKGDIVVLENTGICDGPARLTGIDTKGRLGVQTSEGDFFIQAGQINWRAVYV
jgi:BirA family transcriptional regulator, biotin operon repressor / biotin---[acetyl-CoA-carboxylase] ligase